MGSFIMYDTRGGVRREEFMGEKLIDFVRKCYFPEDMLI